MKYVCGTLADTLQSGFFEYISANIATVEATDTFVVQESNIIINLLYLPMLLLSGATFPLTLLPEFVQAFATVLGKYLFGAPMDGAAVEWSINRSSAKLPAGRLSDRLRAEQVSLHLGNGSRTDTPNDLLGSYSCRPPD